MKFKVGDKVRVREDLVAGNYYARECFIGKMEYNKGKVFEIKGICGGAYIFEENGFHWTDEMLEEVNEEVQEKTFREVIATIKEGEVWESVQDCFQLKEISCTEGMINFRLEGVFIEKTDKSNVVDTGVGRGQTFKLQRKEYSFEEAFKAYEEGKKIESCYSQYKYKKEERLDLYSKTEDEWYGKDSFEIDEIRDKWYIND